MTRVHVAAVLAVFLLFAAIALLVFQLWHKGTADPREEPAALEVIEKFPVRFPTPPTTGNVPHVVKIATARSAPTRPTGEIVDIIRSAFARFGPDVAEQAVRVSRCETGGTFNPAVVNGSGHTGLFQLSPRWHTARAQRLGFSWAQMREALPNALVAADLYGEQKWGPWTCRRAA